MDIKVQKADDAKKHFFIYFIALITITFIYIFLTFWFFNDYLFFLGIYLLVVSYLFFRLFATFRYYVKREARLKGNEYHIRKLEILVNNLIEQRKEIENMLHEKTQLSNKLLEQNIELQNAQEKISTDKEKFATLFEATQLMITTLNLEQILPDILGLINKLVDFKTGRILLLEDEELVIKYHFGYDKKKSLISKVRLGEGICGTAALNQEIVCVENVGEDSRYIKELDETNAELALPLVFQGKLLGILDLQHDQSFIKLDEQENILDILVLFSNFTAMVIHNSMTYTKLKDSYVSTIKALARAIDAKDPYTHGHCERVKNISLEIGKHIGLDPIDLEELEFASFLHDIGKIGLPEAILYKKGRLSAVEFEVIKSHPSIGAKMVGDISFLQRTKRIIEQHHERIDGKGYPYGLKGDHIDFLAKIVTVADSIDAMLTQRPYRSAQNIGYVLEELDNCKGKQFDPMITEIAKEILSKKLEEISMA